MLWRWDQGRLDYFRFESVRAIAQVLADLDGLSLGEGPHDPLRIPLQQATGLPFAPSSRAYPVWRNYSRVFKAACLATAINGRLVVTDLCRHLARTDASQFTIDDYLGLLTRRFYFPSPAFQGWRPEAAKSYPFCAILRYLLTHTNRDGFGAITVDDVFAKVIGNECTGHEPLEHYMTLAPTSLRPVGDQERQIRELLIFLSQFTFLQWSRRSTLFLDIDALDADAFSGLTTLATPEPRNPQDSREAEVLAIGMTAGASSALQWLPLRETPADLIFVEGNRVRTNHLRIERSPKLRSLYFASRAVLPPCDMCLLDTTRAYPWTRNLLEIHHLLPLGSALRVGATSVSLDHIVPLCPNCHRGVHIYYAQCLREQRLPDFPDRTAAECAYRAAKQLVAASR